MSEALEYYISCPKTDPTDTDRVLKQLTKTEAFYHLERGHLIYQRKDDGTWLIVSLQEEPPMFPSLLEGKRNQ